MTTRTNVDLHVADIGNTARRGRRARFCNANSVVNIVVMCDDVYVFDKDGVRIHHNTTTMCMCVHGLSASESS